MAIEQRIVKGSDDIEKALGDTQDKESWMWVGNSNHWLLVKYNRNILINNGFSIEKFNTSDYREAINYITEFLFN